MKLIHLDDGAIDHGRATFHMHLAGAASGPGSTAYEYGRWRASGPETVAGAILECIEHGITNGDDIIYAVSRATRCRQSTVATFLNFLEGDDPQLHLWHAPNGLYRALDRLPAAEASRTPVLLAT